MQDPWKISAEERAKHDSQFFQLKPVGGFVTGNQAKGFFLQSGLPPEVLMQIWSLADMNADGKMDKREFSIACHLISSKLKGLELPKSLPVSIKADPVPTIGTFGAPPPMAQPASMPMGGMSTMGPGGMVGMAPRVGLGGSMTLPPMSGGFSSGFSSGFGPQMPLVNGGPNINTGSWGGVSSAPSASMGPIPSTATFPSPVKTATATSAPVVASGEWAIPHPQKLKYNQQFNTHDQRRKGFLSGVEAKSVLQQTGLSHNILAQIWSLSDIDNDGKLTNEEFCLAMHLVDMARSGQVLPQRLPPNLVPPSYRRPGPPAVMPGAPPTSMGQMIPPGSPAAVQPAAKDAFGDLLGGYGGPPMGAMPMIPIQQDEASTEAEIFRMPETFEDKRKENFDKGQAELEKRRAMLQEQLKKQEEERLAHERAEQEKRERIRQEQERKRQMEMEKQLEKQRAVEFEREEHRRKAMEQREAARRELERQRQSEWERQRRDQLMSEKQREQAQLDRLKRECAEIKFELETLDNKKSEVRIKIEQSRTSVADLTRSIEGMRITRDAKVTDTQKFDKQVQDLQQKLTMLTQQKHQLETQVQGQNHTVDDTFKSVMHSYNSKKISIDRHKESLKQIEGDTAKRLEDIDVNNTEVKKMEKQISSLDIVTTRLKGTLDQKQTDWKAKHSQKPARPPVSNNIPPPKPPAPMIPPVADKSPFGWLDDAFGSQNNTSSARTTPSQDAWSSAFSNMPQSSTVTTNSNRDTPTSDSLAWGNAGLALSNAFGGAKANTSSANTSAVAPPPVKDEDPWASFDADKTFGSSIFSSQGSSWAGTFFGDNKGASPVVVSGPPLSAKSVDSAKPDSAISNYQKHKAMFQFDARHGDELTLMPGETVMVKVDEPGAEPGWVYGLKDDGSKGWFPAAYSEEIPDDGSCPPEPTFFTFPDTAQNLQSPPAETYNDVSAMSPPQEQPVSPPGVDEDNIYENINEITQTSTESQPANSLSTSEQSSFTAVTSSGPSPTPGQGQAAPEGLRVQAMIMWRAKRDNHLSFDKGDTITVQEQQDNWWSGELNGKVGWFPKSFVKVIGDSVTLRPDEIQTNGAEVPEVREPMPEAQINQQMSPPPPGGAESEYFVAMYPYSSGEPGDLTFSLGEMILVTKKDGDWWTGTVADRTGIFPANYVKKMESQGHHPNKRHSLAVPPGFHDPPDEVDAVYANVHAKRPYMKHRSQSLLSLNKHLTTSQKPGKSREIASVLAPYQATGAEQLSLSPGQLIMIRKKSPSGWWEGELQARGQKRKVGWFPANYVKVLASGSRGTPSDSQKSLSPTPQPTDGGSRSATPISYPQPTAAPSLEQVIASFSYAAQNSDELNFEKGAVINVLNKDDNDWWKGEMNGTEGMFPANYVMPLTADNGTASPAPSSLTSGGNEGKRQSAISELIHTEEAYLADLKLVYEVFYKPISSEKILSPEDFQAIFVNWRELITCNKKLLMALKVRRKTCRGQNISFIGDILCENLPHMTPYIRFCSCQLNATTKLVELLEKNAKFKELVQTCSSDPRVLGMPLSTFFMKPMQRITRYPMLVDQILKHTSSEHADHFTLSEAQSKAAEVCSQVNEGVREKDNSDKLEWIQNHVICDGLPEKITFNSVTNCLGPRKYLYSGALYKNKSGKELAGFLFNDFLLLTQPQRPIGQLADVFSFDIKTNMMFKMYRNPIFLNEVMIKKPQNTEADSSLFTLQHTDNDYALKAISPAERDLWVKKVENASKIFLETERKRKERAHSAYHKLRSYGVGRLLVVIVEGSNLHPEQVSGLAMEGCGRLLVIVMEGVHLVASDANGKSDPYCEVNMGVQEHKTKVINNTLNPKWNHSMQFTIKDLQEDVLCITVYDRDLFSPNDFLGRTEIRIKDIQDESREKKGPLVKRLKLYEVESGEVVVKLDLQIFDSIP